MIRSSWPSLMTWNMTISAARSETLISTLTIQSGLEGVFRFVVFSENYGIEKPDPRIFHIALEKAGCSGQQLLNVSDSLKNDVVGAIDAGVRSVWLNRNNMNTAPDIQMDREIKSLAELIELL